MYRAPEVLGVSVAAGTAAGGGAVLATTGFAFGLYLAIAVLLLLVGVVLRRTAMAKG